MERSNTHPDEALKKEDKLEGITEENTGTMDLDELESQLPKEKTEELKEDDPPKEPRKPIKYEIGMENVNEDDFRDKDGNVDGIEFAKKQSRNMLLGYLKNLQLLFRDCLIHMKTEPFDDEEQKIWNDALLGCSKLAIEQFSMMELLEQRAEMFKSKPDGKLELDIKQIDPYLKTLKDGTIVMDTEEFAKDECLAEYKMKEKIGKLKVAYEKELEELRQERSRQENDRENHPEDYDKDGNLILKDNKWVEETKQAVLEAKEEIKAIREERRKREQNLRSQREEKDIKKIENETI
jgi:hypothetical protein